MTVQCIVLASSYKKGYTCKSSLENVHSADCCKADVVLRGKVNQIEHLHFGVQQIGDDLIETMQDSDAA